MPTNHLSRKSVLHITTLHKFRHMFEANKPDDSLKVADDCKGLNRDKKWSMKKQIFEQVIDSLREEGILFVVCPTILRR